MSLKTPFHPGARFRPHTDAGVYTRVGADVLNWLGEEAHRLRRRETLANLLTHGLKVEVRPDGSLGLDWMPKEDPSNAGNLVIQGSGTGTGPLYAVNQYGDAVSADSGIPPIVPSTWTAPKTLGITVPSDSTWRTLVMRITTTRYQPGLIAINSFTGNLSIAATSGDVEDPTLSNSGGLSRYAAATTNGLDVGARIRIDQADDATNYGEYEIATVINSTYSVAGTVSSNPPSDVNDVPFSIAASYLNTEPATAADKDLYQRLVPQFELVARTIAPAAGDMVLADVWYDGTNMRFADRRAQNLLRMDKEAFRPASSYYLTPFVTPTAGIETSAVTIKTETWNPASVTLGNGDHFACHRTDRGSTLVAHKNNSEINVMSYDEATGGFTALANGVASSVTGPALLHAPSPTAAPQHALFYVDAGVLKRKICTDDGTTWGAAATVVDPTAIDGADTAANPFPILLQSGRVLVAFEYYDDSAGVTNIRTVYSDDYMATWQTNSNAGWPIWTEASSGDAHEPCLAQDPITGRLWLAFHTDADEVRLVHSSTLTGIAAFTGLSTSSSEGLLIACDNAAFRPSLWVAPTGHLWVAFEDYVAGGGTPTNGYCNIVMGSVFFDGTDPVQVSYYTLSTPEVASGALSASVKVRPTLLQNRSGRIQILYQNPESSGSTDVLTVAHLIPTPVNFGQMGFVP